MERKIIKIDEEKCNGCGICVIDCHEGAIQIVNGKAKMMREDYCDGLGDCLAGCPKSAISFEVRVAPVYDHEAVQRHRTQLAKGKQRNWPIQIQLAPVQAPYFAQANLLIAADCTAFTSSFRQQDFMKNRVVLIGCTKLDPIDYREKLCQIFQLNDIASICVLRMEVPCCGGMSRVVQEAIAQSKKTIPYEEHIIGIQGNELL